jgi:uncharacterized protein YndB with AHSA1/START domain
MAVTRHHFDHPVDAVFAALTTPETYPDWLVGCRDIRDVEDGWPMPGTRFHHRVGLVGPLTVADSTKVLEVSNPDRLVLEVRARPLGRGRVTFTLLPADDGGTDLAMEEVPLGILSAAKPVIDPVTHHRNAISLSSLEDHLDEVRRRAGTGA